MHDLPASKKGIRVTTDDEVKVVSKEETDDLAKAAEAGPSAIGETRDAGIRIDLVQVT
jgi:hypothetical protein